MTTSRLTQSKPKSPSESRLVEVLDAYLAAAHEGLAPAREDLLADHPEMAEDLEACLASLEFIRQASLSAPPLLVDAKAIEPDDSEPGLGDLGDFRILREVGRGGMGVVYEAIQRSLNRRVALKVLPFAAAMDPTQLRRFQTEALAAAQLHHTHIVPVYSVGCERGVHYYAMQFIEGQTLAQVIAERRRAKEPTLPVRRGSPDAAQAGTEGLLLESRFQAEVGPAEAGTPTPARDQASGSLTPSSRSRAFLRTVAALGIQAAEALDHAHKLGIVHRDIKPANLLLDVEGQLWITDFGLVRLQDDAGLTMTGDLLGTLRYMSPEQALAKRGYLDHRSDIYSLGATLYELLTLRAAIDGQDRQEVLRKIAQDEPTPLRRINPAIPRELETILLKALSKEPGSRYATAQELADDLERFLEHKPIHARRPSWAERTAKWARRHPAFLAFGFILLAGTVTGLAIGSTLLARKQLEVSGQRDRANQLAAIANAQRVLAEQNARLARQAVDEMFTQVAEKWLADQPNLEPVQREFLEKALRYYEEFSRMKDPDPAARESVANALSRVGNVRLRLGMVKPAEEALRQALAIRQSLAAESPANLEFRYQVARQWHGLGNLLLDSGKPNDASDAFRRGIEAAEPLIKNTAVAPRYRQILADTHTALGRVFHRIDQAWDAETEMGQATPILEKLLAEDPQNQDIRESLATNLNNLGTVLWAAARHKEAAAAFRRAIDLQQLLLDASPRSASRQEALALSIANLGSTYLDMRDFREAEKLYRRVLPIRRKLVDEFPRVPDYSRRLAEALGNLAVILRRSGNAPEAEPFCREAVALSETLVRDHPSLPDHRLTLAIAHRRLAVLLHEVGKKAEAEESASRQMEILEPLIADHPDIPMYMARLCEATKLWADILTDLHQVRESDGVFRREIEWSGRLAAQRPKALGCTELHIRLLETFGSLLKKERRDAEAREVFQQALDMAEAVVRENPRWERGREALAWIAGALGRLLAASADPKVRDPIRAVALAAKARDLQPGDRDIWNSIGEAYFHARDWDEAIAALKKADDLRHGSEDVTGWYYLAMAHWQKGDEEQARQLYNKGAVWMENHSYDNDDFVRLRDEASAMLGMSDRSTPTNMKEEYPARPSKP